MKMCFDNHQIVLKMDNSKLRDVTVIKAPSTWGHNWLATKAGSPSQ